MANALYESFIGTLKRERSNYFMCFGRDQSDYIVQTWLRYYHGHRLRCGVGRDNSALDENFVPTVKGQVSCRTDLGGIICECYLDAA